VIGGSPTETLGPSLDETVIEEIIPAAARRPKRERGEKPLLEVKGLRTSFYTRDGVVRAVDGIDFQVDRGEIMGLVGESGCGKSSPACRSCGSWRVRVGSRAARSCSTARTS